jgi:hypothetical protein
MARATLRQTTHGNVEEREHRPLQRSVRSIFTALAKESPEHAHVMHQLDLMRRA